VRACTRKIKWRVAKAFIARSSALLRKDPPSPPTPLPHRGRGETVFQHRTPLPQALPTQRPFSSLSAQEQLSDGSRVSKAKLRAIPSRVLTQQHTLKFRLTTVDSKQESPSPAGRGVGVRACTRSSKRRVGQLFFPKENDFCALKPSPPPPLPWGEGSLSFH